MDTPLLPVANPTRRWARRLAALVLLGAGAVGAHGCQTLHLAKDGPGEVNKQEAKAAVKEDEPHWSFDPNVLRLSEVFRWDTWWGEPKLPEIKDSYVLKGDQLVLVKAPEPGTVDAKLAGAQELFRQGEYAQAEVIFHRIAEHDKNLPRVLEDARFHEAECLRLTGKWPQAGDTYMDLMNKFPRNPYRDQALQHMFEIANDWLEETRQEMREYEEVQQGKRWFVVPRFVSFEKNRPFLDREGRAIQLLEAVRFGDINGPLADKALFLAGSVKFFNEDYKDADYYFSQIHEKHPNSKLAAKAVELAIVSKHMSTGGADYDGRKAAEARILIDSALRNYPELTHDKDKTDYLTKQLANITAQQAEKDYKMAEFWRRTGHPGSAYFYYELVLRRYPGTEYARLAERKKEEIRVEAEKEQGAPISTPPPAKSAPASARETTLPQPRVLPSDLGPPR